MRCGEGQLVLEDASKKKHENFFVKRKKQLQPCCYVVSKHKIIWKILLNSSLRIDLDFNKTGTRI